MKIELKQLPKSEIQLTIEIPKEAMEAFELAAAKRVSESMDIPGFRRGQAPKAFVIAQIGPDAFLEEVLGMAISKSYFDAVKERKLQVITRPEVKVLTKLPLKYEAKVAVLPEISIAEVEKIKAPEKPIAITDKEIEEVVQEMRKYRATYKPVEREIKKGDKVEIDFQGFDEGGASLDKTKSTNHPLFVGDGGMIPGFEDQLVGMKLKQKKKFPLKFPADFHHEPLKGKTVHFEVEIKRTEEVIMPEINDEFVLQIMGEKKSVPEFKEAIKNDIHSRKKAESRKNRENEVLEMLLKEAKLEVPPLLVEEEIDYMIMDTQKEIESKGLKFETFVEKMKKEKKDIRKEYAPEAEKRVRIRLILNYLFRTLKLDVSDEEINNTVTHLLARTPEDQRPNIQKSLAEKGEIYLKLKNNLLLEKLFQKFLGNL